MAYEKLFAELPKGSLSDIIIKRITDALVSGELKPGDKIPTEVEFGNVTLKVEVDGVPSNRAFKNKKELFEVAFEKNPAFAYALSPADDGYDWFAMTDVVYKNCVVQIAADNINDCHGLISTLYQEIAYDILTGEGTQGVFFCTDVEKGGVGMPLGEWP